MNLHAILQARAALIAFACLVSLAVTFQTSRPATAVATGDPIPAKIADGLSQRSAHGERVLVTAFLTDNSFLARIPADTFRLLGTTQGTRAAQRAAQANPTRRSDSELAAASIAESSRNAALPMLREAARPVASQSERVQRLIRRSGGEIIAASPIPNQVTARVTASSLAALERSPSVARVTSTKLPVQMAAPIDGSATWWANGFIGQGSSADGQGSPDVVVFDTGIRTTHTAFKSRLPGDCSTCDGTGPSRVTSPTLRTTFNGSKHANTIAAVLAATARSFDGTTGIAYGLDKLYDNYQANNPGLWDLGITSGGDPGLGGETDLPEAINYSAGIYEDEVDLDPFTSYWDALESKFGILNTVSAGNCGIATPSFTNCADGPHRVSAPGTNPNVITVGGLDTTTLYPDTSGYIAWANTSPGPTWGGRKKPDVIAPVFGTAGTPSQIDDNTWTSGGEGTSFAAPIAAAGSMLLASVGVYKPTAQKAIMINSATPVQGQTSWMPRTGWGALNLSDAFYQRGNYANGTVNGTGPNSARFFEITGASSGDRSTLVWNRRTNIDELATPTNGQILGPTYFNLTNLDLSQFAAADPNTPTATGGSDAGDTSDTSQTVTADNPMPGDGSDGGDNVEQVRSTGAGTQILKVKSLSSVDGASAEPFSIASARPLTALATPIPAVALSAAPSASGSNQDIVVTASITNPSTQLALANASIFLTLPSGTTLTSGTNPRALGTIAASGSTTITWTIQGSTAGTKALSAEATGTTYGETFAGSDSESVSIDDAPPDLVLAPSPAYSSTHAPEFTWSATDADSSVASYDVDSAIDSAPWSTLLSGTTSTAVQLSGNEGQVLHLRVRAIDSAGNISDWKETSTTIDVDPPLITFGAAQTQRGEVGVPVSVSNIGAPIVASSYTFATSAGGTTGALVPKPTYRNNSSDPVGATLTVRATDASGRNVSKTESYTVPPRWLSAGLRIRSAKQRGSRLQLSGTIARGYRGSVTVSVKRRGSVGTRSVTKKVPVKAGKFAAKIKLRRGKYRITVKSPSNGTYLGASNEKRFTLR